MVYIERDGSLHARQPWSLHWAKEKFWGAIAFAMMFFHSLVEPLSSLTNNGSGGGGGGGSSYLGGNRGGGGGGSGGGGFGRGPPRPPGNRPIGRINTAPSCSVPGGCCGGS